MDYEEEDNDVWKDYGEGYENEILIDKKEMELEQRYDESLLNNRKVYSFQLDDYMNGEGQR